MYINYKVLLSIKHTSNKNLRRAHLLIIEKLISNKCRYKKKEKFNYKQFSGKGTASIPQRHLNLRLYFLSFSPEE